MLEIYASLMTEIKTSVDIKAPQEKIWNIISDLDNEPKFWKGTKEVRNISKDENIVNREITIVFRDQKCLQEVTLTPKEKIQAVFTKGIIKGTKTITLISKVDIVKLETIWDIKLSGMMGMFTGIIKKHIKGGTEQALESIKREAER
jgi:ribosome-associated toxin RatA of RatAB toxin-antitoxin module